MLCRVYKKPDGSVAVIHPNPRLKLPTETEAQFVERICQQDAPKSGLDTLPYQDIDSKDLPARTERTKWELDTVGKRITIKRGVQP